jgi:hypothetical protein
MSKTRKFPAKGAIVINTYTRKVQNSFDEIEEYVQELSGHLKDRQKQVVNYVDNLTDSEPNDDEKQKIVEYFAEDYCRYNDTYREMLLHSTFITSFSIFESLFIEICNQIQKRIASKIVLSDLNDKGIERCKKYIVKVVGIDLSEYNTLWNDIAKFNKIRNLIVHNAAKIDNGGNTKIRKHEMFAYIESHADLHFKYKNMGYFQIINSKYIIEFCCVAKSYLTSILNEASKIHRQD